MATIINNPGERVDSGSGVGVILGIILVILIAILLVVFGVPGFRGNTSNPAPAKTTNIQVPDKINVEVGGSTATPSSGTNQQ